MKLYIFALAIGVTSLNTLAEEVVTTTREATKEEQAYLKNKMVMSELTSEEHQRIQKYAEISIENFKRHGKTDFDYTEKSVKFLSEVIDTEGQGYSIDTKNQLISLWGAYYGEALIKKYSGTWVKTNDNAYVVKLDSGLIIFPMTRLANHFTKGHEYAVFAQYSSVTSQPKV